MEDFIFDDDVEEGGAEVDAFCPKCRADTPHVVIHKYEDEIRRVQCSPCGDVHPYRKPRGEQEEEYPEPVTRKRVTKAKPTWEQVMQKPKRETRIYAVSQTYSEHDIISHPAFGMGFVSESLGPDKIEVTFETGRRILVHNRRGLTLSGGHSPGSGLDMGARLPDGGAQTAAGRADARKAAGGESARGKRRGKAETSGREAARPLREAGRSEESRRAMVREGTQSVRERPHKQSDKDKVRAAKEGVRAARERARLARESPVAAPSRETGRGKRVQEIEQASPMGKGRALRSSMPAAGSKTTLRAAEAGRAQSKAGRGAEVRPVAPAGRKPGTRAVESIRKPAVVREPLGSGGKSALRASEERRKTTTRGETDRKSALEASSKRGARGTAASVERQESVGRAKATTVRSAVKSSRKPAARVASAKASGAKPSSSKKPALASARSVKPTATRASKAGGKPKSKGAERVTRAASRGRGAAATSRGKSVSSRGKQASARSKPAASRSKPITDNRAARKAGTEQRTSARSAPRGGKASASKQKPRKSKRR